MAMRNAPNTKVEKYRYDGSPNRNYGAFIIPSPHGSDVLRVIVSCGGGWDHVSVSLKHRCPTWEEMDFVYSIFFKDTETAMQLHVPPGQKINYHQYTLHLWRPQTPDEMNAIKAEWVAHEPSTEHSVPWVAPQAIPMPPSHFV